MTQTTTPAVQSKTITAENQYTDEMELMAGDTVSISLVFSTLNATVQLERKLPGQSSFQRVPNSDGTFGWTASNEQSYVADERQTVRLGVPTGSFTSGSGTVRLGKG